MSSPLILTYRDAIDSLQDFLSMSGTGSTMRDMRRAIASAYRHLTAAHNWAYFYKPGRVQLQPLENTATITYDHTGGTYERELTLAGDVLPSWAEDAVVRIDDQVCAVEDVKSTTVCTLDVNLNPGADVAAASDFSIWPQYYILPVDFVSMSGPWAEADYRLGQYVSPTQFMALDRYRTDTGTLKWYTVRAVDDLHGAMGLYLNPPASSAQSVDFIYKRRPRQLRYSGHETVESQGTITVSGGGVTVTGSGTAFNSKMIGSIIRISDDSTNLPTGLDGAEPYDDERTIMDVTNTESLTVDASVSAIETGVKYVIADPVDLDASLFDAFLRCCEKQIAISRNMKNKAEIFAVYEDALFNAKCGDERVTQRQVAGARGGFYSRLADLPLADDVE